MKGAWQATPTTRGPKGVNYHVFIRVSAHMNAVSPTRSGFPDSGPDPDFLRVCSPEKVWFLFKSPDLNKILTPNALNSQWTVGMMSLALRSVDASTNPKI